MLPQFRTACGQFVLLGLRGPLFLCNTSNRRRDASIVSDQNRKLAHYKRYKWSIVAQYLCYPGFANEHAQILGLRMARALLLAAGSDLWHRFHWI